MNEVDDHSYHASATESPDDIAEMLELDGEVLHAYLTSAIAWVSDLAAGHGPRRIVDLGSGTGAATIALAQAFPAAVVVALDSSGELLCRVEAKARGVGAVNRIIPVKADLDDAWPAMEAVDLAWASMSLHHLADPDRVLTDIFATLRRGGLIAVAEMDGLPRFLPDDLGMGQPGLERRCHDALVRSHARQMPSLGLDWGPRLALAGFRSVTRRTIGIDLDPPLPASTGRYAQIFLRHIRSQLVGIIAAADQAVLDTLVEDGSSNSVLHRHDLAIRGTRTIWAGWKP